MCIEEEANPFYAQNKLKEVFEEAIRTLYFDELEGLQHAISSQIERRTEMYQEEFGRARSDLAGWAEANGMTKEQAASFVRDHFGAAASNSIAS